MRKIFLFILLGAAVSAVAMHHVNKPPLYPTVWHKPDSALTYPSLLDSIVSPDSYTMMMVYRSPCSSTKQPLWTFTNDSNFHTVVLSEQQSVPTIYTKYQTLSCDTAALDSCYLHIGANEDSVSHIQLYEAAYFPYLLTRPQALMFQTYLALKHGITLNHSNYLSTQGEIIWDARINRDYYNHIQGFGFDPFYHYYSLNSVSAEDTVLMVSTTDSIPPYSYALLGDNNAPMDWIPDEGNHAMLQRHWKMHTTGNISELTLSVSTHAFPDEIDTLLLVLLSEDNQIISYIYPSSIDTAGIAKYMLPSQDIYFSFVSRFEYSHQRTKIKKSNVQQDSAETELISDIKLYPTFTHGAFILDITMARETQLVITIHDNAGKLIQRHDLAPLSSYQYNGRVSNQGVYLISVSDAYSNILYTHELIVY